MSRAQTPLRLGHPQEDWSNLGKPSEDARILESTVEQCEKLMEAFVSDADQTLQSARGEGADGGLVRFVNTWKNKFTHFLQDKSAFETETAAVAAEESDTSRECEDPTNSAS